jgi:hypothetical protein
MRRRERIRRLERLGEQRARERYVEAAERTAERRRNVDRHVRVTLRRARRDRALEHVVRDDGDAERERIRIRAERRSERKRRVARAVGDDGESIGVRGRGGGTRGRTRCGGGRTGRESRAAAHGCAHVERTVRMRHVRHGDTGVEAVADARELGQNRVGHERLRGDERRLAVAEARVARERERHHAPRRQIVR